LELHRYANDIAHAEKHIEPEIHWLVRIGGRNIERKDDVVLVADRLTARVAESHRRRPQNGERFNIAGTRPVELRRDARIARHAPIGLPAFVESKIKTGAPDAALRPTTDETGIIARLCARMC